MRAVQQRRRWIGRDGWRTGMGLVALAGVVLAASGCVVAIGNRGTKDEAQRMRLTADERAHAAVVPEGGKLPPFSVVERQRLARLGPGTTIELFREVFPEAVFRAARDLDGRQVVVYEVRDRRLWRYEGHDDGAIHDRPVFFRFVDGVLESWRVGRDDEGPSDWVTADLAGPGQG